jgi:peptidoglycan hydrolase-like protein with peptidoglycan-binding domain
MFGPDTSVPRVKSPVFPVVFVAALAVATAQFTIEAQAATPAFPEIHKGGQNRPAVPATPALIKQIQERLRDAGLYSGPVDGVMTDSVADAIRAYQRRTGRPVDGLATKDLAEHMATQAEVGQMLKRLEQTKEEKIEEARKLLLSRAETRGLLSKELKNEVADPTRDATPCFRNPNEKCLLGEAVESAKAIYKSELRDWAYGEILAAQAKAGLVKSAIETVGRIGDPRLIMVALRDIATAQAKEGRIDQARSAANIIPDPQKKIEAMIAVARILVKQGDKAGAVKTAGEIVELADKFDKGLGQVTVLTQMAIIYQKAGEPDEARKLLGRLEALAESNNPETGLKRAERAAALRHVASAFAEIGEPAKALGIVAKAPGSFDRTAVEMSVATAHADAGDIDEAFATAKKIRDSRYLAVVLGRIAVVQARAGKKAAADDTIAQALATTSDVKMPYAKSYAVSQIALALIEMAKFEGDDALKRATHTAQRIDDDRLRAYTLWSVAAAYEEEGARKEAEHASALADQATGDIKSALSQVWLLGDVASERAALGQGEFAATAFKRGLQISESIHNSWGRSRALAKLAGTLYDLR